MSNQKLWRQSWCLWRTWKTEAYCFLSGAESKNICIQTNVLSNMNQSQKRAWVDDDRPSIRTYSTKTNLAITLPRYLQHKPQFDTASKLGNKSRPYSVYLFRFCLLEAPASRDIWIASAFRSSSSSSCRSLSSLSSLFFRRLFWLAAAASTILFSAAISPSRLLLLRLNSANYHIHHQFLHLTSHSILSVKTIRSFTKVRVSIPSFSATCN